MAAAGSTPPPDDDFRFLEGLPPAGVAGLPGGGPPTPNQILNQPPAKRLKQPARVSQQPATAASPATQDPDFAFLEGRPVSGGYQPRPNVLEAPAPPVLPPVPRGTPGAVPPHAGFGDLHRYEAETAPPPPPVPQTSAGALKRQLDQEGLFIHQEERNLKQFRAAIDSGQAPEEAKEPYNQRVRDQAARVAHWQQLNAQYQGLPSATVPPIAPLQYPPSPFAARLAAIEPVFQKRQHGPYSPAVLARTRQQYGLAHVELANTFKPRQEELDADKARLDAEGKQLDDLARAAEAGQLSPATFTALKRAARQHQANVDAFKAAVDQHNASVKRFGQFLDKNKEQDLHLGMIYPEEVGGVESPNAAARALNMTEDFFTPIATAARKNIPAARRALMLKGDYPPLPELPANLPADQRAALIRQKNDLIALLTSGQSPSGTPGFSPLFAIDPTTGEARPLPNARTLTPFQQQILPILLKQVQAENTARRMAGVQKAAAVDAATQAVALLVGGAGGALVERQIGARLLPYLFKSLEAPVLTSNTEYLTRLLVGRIVPQVAGNVAGFTAGGAAGAFTAGALLGPARFDPKTGKPLPVSIGQRLQYGAEAAGRQIVPSAVTGLAWGVGSAIVGTVLPALVKSRYDPVQGPAFNEAFTQEAAGRARAAGIDLTPEESGRFSQRLNQIQRAPQVTKPALWRSFVRDWNAFIGSGRLLTGEVPGEGEGFTGGGTPRTGSLGPAPPQLPGAPQFFGGPPTVGPTIMTPGGLEWDLRTRPVEDVQGLRDQYSGLAAGGGLNPEQQAAYGRLQRWLDGYQQYQAQQKTAPVSPAAHAAIQTALTTDARRYGIPALSTAEQAAEAKGDTGLSRLLATAVQDQQAVVAQTINAGFAPPDHPLAAGLVPPLGASTYRQLTPTQFASLPAAARQALLLQDLTNSLHVVQPGALPFYRVPPNVRTQQDLAALADRYYQVASGHLALLFPAAAPLASAAPAAAPAPEAPVPSPAGQPVQRQDLAPGVVIGFPNGLTVRLTAPVGQQGQKAWNGEVLQQGKSSFRPGTTAPIPTENLLAGGTIVSPAEAPPSAPATPISTPASSTLGGLPTAPAPGGIIPTAPSGGTLPAGGSTAPAGLPPEPERSVAGDTTPSPNGLPLPPLPSTTAPPPSPAAAPVTEREIRPGARVRSTGTGIEYEIQGRSEANKWNATVLSKPRTSRVPVNVGDVRQLPEAKLLEPGLYEYLGNDRPEEAPSAAEATAPSAPTTTSIPAATPPSESAPPGPTPVAPSGTISPPGSIAAPSEPAPTAAAPAPAAPTTPEERPSVSSTRPGRSAAPTEPPSVPHPPSPSSTKTELPRPVALLIDELLARINERMTADERIFSNNLELEAFAQPILGGSRAAGTYGAQTVYNALEAAVNRYVIEQQFGQQEAKAALAHVRDLQNALPTQTIRAGDKDALQQFSTPPTLALVAAYALQAKPGEDLLEPSAGTGSLLAMAQSLYANTPRQYFANEIDPERRAILDEFFTPRTFDVDARYLNAMLPHALSFDLILMNPPFSSAPGQRAQNTNVIGFDHVEQALKRLRPGGRLVAILGQGAALDRPTAAPFWQKVREQYTLRANIGLPGKEYQKYGTSFATQLVIIDNAGPTAADASIWTDSPANVEAVLEGLYERGILVRTEGVGRAPALGPAVTGATGERGGAVGEAPRGRRGGTRSGQAGGREELAVPPEPGAPREAVPTGVPEPAAGAGSQPGKPAGGEPAPVPVPEVRSEPAGPGNQPDRQLAPKKKPAKAKAPAAPTEERQDIGTQYVSYSPAYVLEGRPHPAVMVETRSLAAVDPPPITVTHALREEALHPTPAVAAEVARLTGRPAPDPNDLGISNLQLENVLYAKQRHDTDLPDGSRAGVLVGDGTGSGKGRSLAAIAADNWERGNRRIYWVSARAALLDAAKDDLASIGYGHIPIKLLNDFPGGEWMPEEFEGIVFSTYNTLIDTAKSGSLSGTKRRVVLERWLAGGTDENKEGDKGDRALILMDESHRMKAAVAQPRGAQPSETARDGMRLQNNLPRTRFVYSSATAMTDLDNMAYLLRLGLWGQGTAWPGGFNDFSQEMQDRDKMEMIARDMKSRGMYLAREISFKDPAERPEQSVEFRTLTHTLTAEDERIYNLVAEAWQTVFQNFEAALAVTGNAPGARKTALGQFWSGHQRFFRQFLTALKLPSLYADVDRQLANNRSVVISLIGTGEAATQKAIGEAIRNDAGLDDLDLTPIQGLVRLVERSFPTQQWIEELGPDGETTVLVPAVDKDGNPVHDPEALELKERLLERLAAITERLPGNPLDEILFRYGHDRVAELTGRQKRLEHGPAGELVYAPRGGSAANVAEKDRFNAGEKRVAIISTSANEGISLQAGRRFQNQQRRVQYMFELNWSADQQMQANGRTHRSNQVSAPEFVIVNTNAGGETRFAATIARRLASLGALTRGQREATGAGGALDQFDYENDYGIAALEALYRHMLGGGQLPDLANPRESLRKMGLMKRDQYGQENLPQESRTITKFMNRLLALPVAEQNPIFAAFANAHENLVTQAQDRGEFDFGVQDIRGQNVREAAPPQVVHTDPTTGAETVYHHIVSDEPAQPVTLERLDRIKEAERHGYYRRKSDEKLVYIAHTDSPVNPYKVITPTNWRSAVIGSGDLGANFDRIPEPRQIGARDLWQAEVDQVPATSPRHYHLITGAVLPIYARLRSTGQQKFEVRRAKLPENVRVVGLSLQPTHYKKILRALGATAAAVNPEDLYHSILETGEEVELVSGLSLKRATIGGVRVVRVMGVEDDLRKDLVKPLGPIRAERIGTTYRYSVWIVADPKQGPSALAQLLQRFPPLEAGGTAPVAAGPTVPAPRLRGLKVIPPRQVPLMAPPGWPVPFPTLRWLEGHAAALSVVFQGLAQDGLDPERAAAAHDFGILLWPEATVPDQKEPLFLGGLSAPIEGAGRSVSINPFPPQYGTVKGTAGDEAQRARLYQGLKESTDPEYVADEVLTSMIHELGHQLTEEEGAPLVEAISQIEARLGPEKLKEARDAIRALITGADGRLAAGYLAARRGYYARARADRRPLPTLRAQSAAGGGRMLAQALGGRGPPEPAPDRGHGRAAPRRRGPGHRTEPAELPDPGLERQIERAKRLPEHPYAWFVQAWRDLPNMFLRDWPFLPHNDPRYAELRARATHLDGAWQLANMNAVLALKQVYDGLNPYDQTLYRRAILVFDLEEEVAEQTGRLLERFGPNADPAQIESLIMLPQGDGSEEERWTPVKAAEQADWMRGELRLPQNQATAEALDLRKLVFGQVFDRLTAAIASVTGKRPELSRREWFHHMINDFAEEERARRGAPSQGRLKAPFQPMLLRREGSLRNYNTDDIAVELGWLPGALYSCYVHEFMAWVRDQYDIKPLLKRLALRINMERLWPLLEEMAAAINAQERKGEPVTAADLYSSRYNAPIAAGFRQLGWLCREHPDWLPGDDDPRWEGMIELMAENYDLRSDAESVGNPPVEIDPESTRTFFAWLRWLLTPPQAGQAGSGAAAQIFKGIYQKRARIKADLGKEHVDWWDLIHYAYELGGEKVDYRDHVTWQPKPGNTFYQTWALRDRIAQQILEAEESGTGLALNLKPGDLRHIRAIGGRKPEWVLPKAVADTLDNFKNPFQSSHALVKAAGLVGSHWRQWTLLNALHYVGYNVRNFMTDVEMLAVNPDAWKYVKPALLMLSDYLWRRRVPEPDLMEWLDWGGHAASLQASQARPTGAQLDMLDHLRTDKTLNERTVIRAMNAFRVFSDFREAVIRFAMYLSYRDQMLADPEGKPKNFGASNRRDIMAIRDLRLRAFRLSDDLMGPYDRVPQGFKLYRMVLPSPFLTWQIINKRRMLGLLNNQVIEAAADWLVMRMPLEGGGGGADQPPRLPPTGGGGGGADEGPGESDAERRARLQEVLSRKERLKRWAQLRREALRRNLNWRWVALQLGKGLMFWVFLGRFLVRLNWYNALTTGYNWAFHADEERALPPWVRNRPHLDFGRVPGTDLYGYFDRTSGVGDAASFFGLDDVRGYIERYQQGRMSLTQIAIDMLLRNPVQEVANQAGLPKVVAEFALRRKAFPDLTEPREIPDRWQYLFDQLSLGKVYQQWRGIPHTGGKLILPASVLGVTLFHAGESPFNEMRETAIQWAKDHQFGAAPGPPGEQDRSQAAYWARKSLKAGDQDAYRHFLILYWQYGGDDKHFSQSLKFLYPLYRWPRGQRQDFLLSLKGGEVERWRNALWYLQQTVTPEVKIEPDEIKEHGHEPIVAFDDWLWTKIKSDIDAQHRFEDFEELHPKEAAERERLKAFRAGGVEE